ncbi:MAG: RadC family protein [Solidesulfovibrio sp. DCME]|uniref:RadC family protein n=1 Tax=Solidesulfovibrio sp. DCME TaxID=3447380 RepID=UPI003D11FE2D
MLTKKEPPHYLGHRRRLKDRLMENSRALADYEVLELLLGYVNVRRDNKPLAKELIARFGGVRGALLAREEELRAVPGIGPGAMEFVTLWREVWARFHEQPLRDRASLNHPELVAEMARSRLGAKEREELWMALVDAKNRLLAWEQVSQGTVDQAAIYPREILGAALRHKACGIILVHNHPSGDPRPSPEDKAITRRIASAAREMDLRVLDHVIVTAGGYFSFQVEGLV